MRGLAPHLTSTLHNLDTWDADIVVLTETKLLHKQGWVQGHIRNTLQRYRMFASSKPYYKKPSHASAGCCILVGEAYARLQHHITPHNPPVHLQGHVCHIRIATPNSTPLDVIGVYAPENTDTRDAIHQYCTGAAAAAKAAGTHLVVAGDFNAVLHDSDRTGTGPEAPPLDPADKAHAEFCTTAHLAPLPHASPRPWTYEQTRNGMPTHRSRIDDVLLCSTLHTALDTELQAGGAIAHESIVDGPGTSFDHRPLLACIPLTAIKLYPAPLPPTDTSTTPEPCTWRNVVLPVSADTLQRGRSKIEAQHILPLSRLAARLRPLYDDISALLRRHSLPPDHPQHLTATALNEALAAHADLQAFNTDAFARDDLNSYMQACLQTLLAEVHIKPPRTGHLHPRRRLNRKLHHCHKRIALHKKALDLLPMAPPPAAQDPGGA